ncbi:MAG: SurA N-terminal domain-containing protein [Thermoanaerobaculia bacterium]
MKKLAGFLLLAMPWNLAAAELVDRVVARVGDSMISQSELDQRVERARKDPGAPPDVNRLRLIVLEQMIRQKIVDDKAAALGLTMSEDEVAEAVERVKSQYGMKSDEEFDRALAANGLTKDILRTQLRETLLTNKLLAREVPINLNDDAVRTEYERTKDKLYVVPEKANVSEILVRFAPDDPASQEAARIKIEDAQKRIRAGAPFADVAREITEGPARARGGELGLVAKGDLTRELDSAIFGGDLSSPIAVRDGYALLSVTGRQPAGFRPFDEVKDNIRKKMSEEIYDKKFAEYLADLRKSAFVKIFDKDLEAADAASLKEKS